MRSNQCGRSVDAIADAMRTTARPRSRDIVSQERRGEKNEEEEEEEVVVVVGKEGEMGEEEEKEADSRRQRK